jgi:hypothetical protein
MNRPNAGYDSFNSFGGISRFSGANIAIKRRERSSTNDFSAPDPLLVTSDRDIRIGGLRQSVTDFNETYTITIRNKAPNRTPVTIFGAKKFSDLENFGLPLNIDISDRESYQKILLRSEQQPFIIGMFRVNSSAEEQLRNHVTVTESDGHGNSRSTPYFLAPPPLSFQTTIVEVSPQSEITVNSLTEISFNLMGLMYQSYSL